MKNRAGLVLVGAAVAILGYALVYSGVSHLNPSISPTGEVGVLQSLTLSGGAAGGRPRRQPTRRPRKGKP